MSTRQLFQPFWRSIAFSAVRNVDSRPNTVRYLAELLELSVSELLLLIQSQALPWLVLHKKRDVIQKIAQVRKETQIFEPILDNENLGPILALLLIQEANDIEEYAMNLLRHISPHFNKTNLGALLLAEPIITCLELLKAAGDADDDRKPHVSNNPMERVCYSMVTAFSRYITH